MVLILLTTRSNFSIEEIKNDSTDEYMSSVHVLNLNSIEGIGDY